MRYLRCCCSRRTWCLRCWLRTRRAGLRCRCWRCCGRSTRSASSDAVICPRCRRPLLVSTSSSPSPTWPPVRSSNLRHFPVSSTSRWFWLVDGVRQGSHPRKTMSPWYCWFTCAASVKVVASAVPSPKVKLTTFHWRAYVGAHFPPRPSR